MFNGFHLSQPHYFNRRLSKRLEELYLSVAILDFALAAVVLLEPIYLWQHGYHVTAIMVYYLVVYGLYFFLAPLGGKLVAEYGPERNIAASTIMLTGYYLSLLLLPANPMWFWIAPVFFALQKMLYWPAYHADFVDNSDRGERGKEYSALWSLTTVVYVLGPLAGGLMVAMFGFSALFYAVIILILCSSVPLFMSPMPRRQHPYSYWAGLWAPFRSRFRRWTVAFLGLGEELILLTIWPLFIALAFHDYEKFGLAISMATLITAVVTLALGQFIDRKNPRLPLRIATVLSVLTWAVRPFVASIQMVFLSDTVGRIVKNTSFVSLSAEVYDRAARERSAIVHGVLLEQGFAISKSLAAVLVIICAHFFNPFTASFLVATGMSLFYLAL